jgi:plasmid stability protein
MHMNATRRHLTIRNLPPNVASALDLERKRRGTSLNQTVIDLLRQSLGTGTRRSNGLAKLAGTWSEADWKKFQSNTAGFEAIDPEMWR